MSLTNLGMVLVNHAAPAELTATAALNQMDNTDYQGDLNKALIDAFDAYLKATKGRELNDKEIAAVLRTANDLVYDLDKK